MSTNVRDENGDTYIPASQRPDGSWRKPRRVKEGYVPQEEVPLYESKGKQFVSRQLKPVVTLPPGVNPHHSIPGLFINNDEKEKTKKKKKPTTKVEVENVTKQVDQLLITEGTPHSTQESTDPVKKLRNLKKRLREVEVLEEKLRKGELVKPDPDQLKKINRKGDLVLQIQELEKKL